MTPETVLARFDPEAITAAELSAHFRIRMPYARVLLRRARAAAAEPDEPDPPEARLLNRDPPTFEERWLMDRGYTRQQAWDLLWMP